MAFETNPGGGGVTVTPVQSVPPVPVPGGAPVASTAPYVPSAGAAPATPLTAPSQSITTTPAYTPDYTAAITNDPAYTQAVSNNQQNQAQAAAARTAALKSAVIQYGGLPTGFNDAYGDIDQATLDAAKNNQYSTLAGLQRNYQESVDQFRKALAARGALQSGDLNYGQNTLDTGLGQNEYDAGNAFGNTATGAINAYTGVLNSDNANLVGAISSAESNAYQDPANMPVAAGTATLDSGRSAQAGRPIYGDGNGNYYYQDGTPYTLPADTTSNPNASTTPYIPGAGMGAGAGVNRGASLAL